ncbi:M14 family zinc carboxypeptidase [Lentzea sp. NPDC058436]|uniref:M14 family zinc carboxypeptidase n=1 Tax=Lentzea sp. NPDC058436 TaxID=3346499 RepID=UPI0036482381
MSFLIDEGLTMTNIPHAVSRRTLFRGALLGTLALTPLLAGCDDESPVEAVHRGLLDDLAEIRAFPTVDEMHEFGARMAREHSDRAALTEVGRSRAGDPVQMLSVRARNPRGRVLVVGQPHPNEPIGMATVVALAERLLARPGALDAAGADWFFVLCADPDATRLNEGWFRGPWTREHYARNFFRPGGEQQVEWTFPFRAGSFAVDAPMPETRALMAAIDQVKPTVLASLHNSETGGAYYYANAGAAPLYPVLTGLCDIHGIPLHRGEPEIPVAAELSPAVYTLPTARMIYDYVEQAGGDPAQVVTGGNTGDYASRHGAVLGLAVELPYWRDERAGDTTAGTVSRRDAALRGLDIRTEMAQRLQALRSAAEPLTAGPFRDALDSFLTPMSPEALQAERLQIESDPEHQRPATAAEAFSAVADAHSLRLRLGGMLLRAMPSGARVRAEADDLLKQWCAEADSHSPADPVPIRDLVAVQGKAVLATVAHSLR